MLGAGPAWATRPGPTGDGSGWVVGGMNGLVTSQRPALTPLPAPTAPPVPPTAGIDVSFVQCGATLPTDRAFAVVGVNGGRANTYNPCLPDQLAYAEALHGGTNQPVAQVYLNTGDPGNTVGDWPSPNQLGAYGSTSTPAGTCEFAAGTSGPGANSPGCAYIYGYDMVAGIVTPSGSVEGAAPHFARVTGRSLGSQPVWLDVETENSWQKDRAMNVADLQGVVDAVRAAAGSADPVTVGIYSTAYQWDRITGTPIGDAAGNLTGPAWVAGASTAVDAQLTCALASSFTGGRVALVQWVGAGFDENLSCTG